MGIKIRTAAPKRTSSSLASMAGKANWWWRSADTCLFKSLSRCLFWDAATRDDRRILPQKGAPGLLFLSPLAVLKDMSLFQGYLLKLGSDFSSPLTWKKKNLQQNPSRAAALLWTVVLVHVRIQEGTRRGWQH